MTIVNSEAYVALRQAGVSQEIACRYAQDFADRDWRLARLEAELADLSVGPGAKATRMAGRLSLLHWQCGIAIAGLAVLVIKAFA